MAACGYPTIIAPITVQLRRLLGDLQQDSFLISSIKPYGETGSANKKKESYRAIRGPWAYLSQVGRISGELLVESSAH